MCYCATPGNSINRDTDLYNQKVQKSFLWLIYVGGLPFSEAKGGMDGGGREWEEREQGGETL